MISDVRSLELGIFRVFQFSWFSKRALRALACKVNLVSSVCFGGGMRSKAEVLDCSSEGVSSFGVSIICLFTMHQY